MNQRAASVQTADQRTPMLIGMLIDAANRPTLGVDRCGAIV
jgi:hypothetical protein